MVAFPTVEWLEQYVKQLNANADMKTSGKGWGVDWNGDFIFQIENLPIDKIAKIEKMVQDGNEAELTAISQKMGMSLEDGLELIQKLNQLVENYVDGTTVYAYIGLKNGSCTGAELIKKPSDKEVGFILSGSYENWKKLAKAETDATKLVLTRKMKLEGKMTMVMKYIKAVQTMGKVASEVQTEYLDELVD